MRYCDDCGDDLGEDVPYYYSKCRACYRATKQLETDTLASELARQTARAEQFKRLARERRLKLEILAANGGGVESELTAERIHDLLMLCHPDKHGGASAKANEITRWLLDVRSRLQGRR